MDDGGNALIVGLPALRSRHPRPTRVLSSVVILDYLQAPLPGGPYDLVMILRVLEIPDVYEAGG